MKKNVIYLCAAAVIVVAVYGISVVSNKDKNKAVTLPAKEERPVDNTVVKETPKPITQKSTPTKKAEKTEEVKKANMYDENNILPLSAVAEISTLTDSMKESVNSLIENSNLYYLKKHKDKVFMIVGNSGDEKYQRHDIEFVEINHSGHKKVTKFGNIEEHAGDNDEWTFDETSNLPQKHIKYNSKGDIEYTEIWNYSPDEQIKYEMKDGNGKVLSIKKETPDGDTNVRVEHLIYDEDGNTKLNISANYEGPDITRFTYFNADKPHDGITLMSTYEDGVKTKEVVYSSNYKVQNTYEAEYKDGERVNIRILDDENNVVEDIKAE